MTVTSVMVGAVSHADAVVATKVSSTADVRVAVDTDPALSDPTFYGPVTPDATGLFAKVTVTGLDPDTRYFYAVEHDGTLDAFFHGQFVTFPPLGQPADFILGMAGDAGSAPEFPGVGDVLAPNRMSNSPIFDTVRERAVNEGWLMFHHLGDLHYYDLGSGVVGSGSLAEYRRAYDDVLLQPRQHALYRNVAFNYHWDDHDYGPNDADRTLPNKANAAQAYRDRVPHYTLAENSGPIYHSFRVGRVLFVVFDNRYNRDPNNSPDGPNKTLLGTAQKAWFANLLNESDAEALVILTSSQWMAAGGDSWGSFADERDEITQLVIDTGWRDRTVMAHADRHAIGLDSGANNQWGGWPVLQAASLDAIPSGVGTGPTFDVVPDRPGRMQYGTLAVHDDGTRIIITLTAYHEDEVLGVYRHGIIVEEQPAPTEAICDIITGSHRMLADARIVETYQTGGDPTGVDVRIVDGDVQLDGTAKVRGTLSLTIPGNQENNPRTVFPRGDNLLLGPYGNEVFVRRGIGLGANVIMIPLGYYRIDDTDQPDAARGPIRLSCSDRMATVIDARLMQPRIYPPSVTVASVVYDLVSEVYPEAVIVFDDDSGTRPIGRSIVVEESRYDALLDLATSLGKIMYWDGFGFFRVRTAPDPEEIFCQLRSGHDGVLVSARRRLSRNGVYNAVVASGEGTDIVDPVIGIAVDNNQNSPTYFYGRFGPVPRYYKSPLLVTTAQAVTAAGAMLRRILGLPYSVDFGAIVHPAIEPYVAIRIVHDDGNRDTHIVDRVTIPLSADQAMTGSTREQKVGTNVGELTT